MSGSQPGPGPDPAGQQRAEIIEVSGEPHAWSSEVGPIGRRSSRAIIVAAGLVVGLGLIALATLTSLDRAQPTASALPGLALPSGPFAELAGGLPVISVGAAAGLGAEPSDGSDELAIGGWYSAVRVVEACQPSDQPLGTCVSDWQAVIESRPDARWSRDGVSHPVQAGTASITPLFIDPVQPPILAGDTIAGSSEIVPPSPLILVGHFHDDRLCGEADGPTAACPAFVVDAIADPIGTIGAGASLDGVPGTRLGTSVAMIIQAQLRPNGIVLSDGALPWSVDLSAPPYVEPSADGPPADGRTVWLVRGYLTADSGRMTASWMAIDDTSGQVWGPLAVPSAGSPLPTGMPMTIDGLSVKTVAAALPATRGTSPLVAIGGYLSSDRAVEGCPLEPTSDKPDPCSGTQLVLVDRPIPVLQPNDATFLYEISVPPQMASIRPEILPGTVVADPWANARTLDDRLESRPVVMVGRFGDPRSLECAAGPGGGSAGCDSSFVVDQLAWIDGAPENPSIFISPGVKPTKSVTAVLGATASWFLPDDLPALVSISSVRASDAGALAGVSLDGQGDQLFWIVHVVSTLPAGPASTFLVFDDRSLSLVEISP